MALPADVDGFEYITDGQLISAGSSCLGKVRGAAHQIAFDNLGHQGQLLLLVPFHASEREHAVQIRHDRCSLRPGVETLRDLHAERAVHVTGDARRPGYMHDTSTAGANAAHSAEAAPAPKTSHRAASYDRGVQIAAARLRLVTDSQLGLETPDWVKELAAGKPRSRAS